MNYLSGAGLIIAVVMLGSVLMTEAFLHLSDCLVGVEVVAIPAILLLRFREE